MQRQQVLDNLAMFACDANALAWHLKITGGVVQLADQGQGFIGANLGGPGVVAPNVGLQRNVLGQWNVDPTIESDELQLLQIAYRKAVDPLDADGSNKRTAYGEICELANDYHIALARHVALDILDTMQQSAGGAQFERLELLRGELIGLYDEIDELSLKVDPYNPDKFAAGGGEVHNKVDFLKEQVIRLLYEVRQSSVEQVRAYHRPGRNVGLVEQVEDKIEALVKLFEEHNDGAPNPFAMPWLCQGGKGDVPACACLVGKYRGCGCECYVWITPENMQQFSDFVLIVLALAPPTSQETSPFPAGFGAANNPNF